MTTDALLAISLNVVIPSLLAVAGGVLAIRAFRDAKSTERWAWLGVFVFLFLVAVVLAFAQQVLFTEEQKRSDDKAAQIEARRSDEAKYTQGQLSFTQGQLESINKVLSTVVSRSGESGLTKGML